MGFPTFSYPIDGLFRQSPICRRGRAAILATAWAFLAGLFCVQETAAQTCTSGGATLACLEIRNDHPVARSDEVAYSGVPIPQAANLVTTDRLSVTDLAGTRQPAQFRILARWGAPLADTAAPVRWLEVAVQTPVAAATTLELRLVLEATPPPGPANPLTVTQDGADYEIATGVATFRIDPSLPSLLEQVDLGAQNVFSHQPGAGPRAVIGGTVLDTAGIQGVFLDAGTFEVLETGPLRASFAVRGHFIEADGATRCTAYEPALAAYEAVGFTAVWSFIRGTGHADLAYHVRNECLDARSGLFLDGAMTFDSVSWEMPLDGAMMTAHVAGSGAIQSAVANAQAEQRKGAGNPWLRRARAILGATEIETAQTLEGPIVALGDANRTVSVQMPWMRYREPQSLAAEAGTLSARIISEPLVVGAGKGLWNQVRWSFLGAVASSAELETPRNANLAFLERGLLVRSQLTDLNAALLFPSLGTDATSLLKSEYTRFMRLWHDDTVDPGGQHDLAKTYGSQLWPDTQGATWANAANDDGPSNNSGGLNYWNASRAELLEFFRDGDPIWAWDLALPLTWQQLFSAYVNVGENGDGFKNGLALTSPLCDIATNLCNEGNWYRYSGGSDDYTYTFGNLAYALRPSYALNRRFAQAGDTVATRYNIPRAQQATRQVNVSQVDLTRQVIQHFVQLANCAEFVPGAEGQACHDRLIELVTELSEENMASGLICQGDLQPQVPSLCMPVGGDPNLDWCDCVQPQQFMLNSLMIPFLTRMLFNYGDVGGNLQSGLALSSWHLYRAGIAIPAGQAPAQPSDPQRPGIPFNPPEDWYGQPGWDLDVIPFLVQDVDVVDDDPNSPDVGTDEANTVLEANKPQTVAQFLIADSLDPSLRLCEVSRAALNDQFMLDAWDVYEFFGGWLKPTAQVMQGMVFGVGLYDVCATGGNQAPTAMITAPMAGQSFASGATITFTGTADDIEDGDLSAALAWSSDLDGALGTGGTVMSTLSDGNHLITASVNDSGGLTAQATVAITVGGAGNTAPTVAITEPGDGATFESGANIAFTGMADDLEDGDLAATLAWASDLDGALGTGPTVMGLLSDGTHQITASVTDSGGLMAQATISITVGGACQGFVLDEDFENGLGAWTASGLWHLVASSGCADPAFSSPVTSAYFGQDATCDFDTGATEVGELISPTVNVTEGAELTFAYLREVEDTPAATVDFTEVAVRPSGGGDWTVVWILDSTTPSAPGWQTIDPISLAGFLGQDVQIRFRFDSDDEQFNAFLGWMVDDVRVTGCDAGGIFADGFESGDVTAWTTSIP